MEEMQALIRILLLDQLDQESSGLIPMSDKLDSGFYSDEINPYSYTYHHP